MLYFSVSDTSDWCLQCFDTVSMSDEMLVWLSIWSEVLIVCIWSG